ncbi:hypothetical protein ABT354_36010 [Streptomyces sp. NPDC000594]|uniref:hypothetical protein n=1 Tax=Streptomyces sp. NPDC000594 TaxID=3154261 RepID=UPI00332C90FB
MKQRIDPKPVTSVSLSRRLPQALWLRPAAGLLLAGPAQRGGLDRRGLAAPLCTGLVDRRRRIVRDDVGLGERPARQLPHRRGLLLHHLRDGRVRQGRPDNLPVRLDRAAVSLGRIRRSTKAAGTVGCGAGMAAAVLRPPFTGAGARTWTARTIAPCTRSLAAAISFGAFQRSCVPYAGASGATSRRPVSASKPTAWT